MGVAASSTDDENETLTGLDIEVSRSTSGEEEIPGSSLPLPFARVSVSKNGIFFDRDNEDMRCKLEKIRSKTTTKSERQKLFNDLFDVLEHSLEEDTVVIPVSSSSSSEAEAATLGGSSSRTLHTTHTSQTVPVANYAAVSSDAEETKELEKICSKARALNAPDQKIPPMKLRKKKNMFVRVIDPSENYREDSESQDQDRQKEITKSVLMSHVHSVRWWKKPRGMKSIEDDYLYLVFKMHKKGQAGQEEQDELELCTSTAKGVKRKVQNNGAVSSLFFDAVTHYSCYWDETVQFDISSSAAFLQKQREEEPQKNEDADETDDWEMECMEIEVWSQRTGVAPQPSSNSIAQSKEDVLLATSKLDLREVLELATGEKEYKWAVVYHSLFSQQTNSTKDSAEMGGFIIRFSLRVDKTVSIPFINPEASNYNLAESKNIPMSIRQLRDLSSTIVTRREIREMSSADQFRFCQAVIAMMEDTPMMPTSTDSTTPAGQYFRLACYHGWPSFYCTHHQEKFPSWHRAYLCEFERALMRTDMLLGNDGTLALPYWDWTRADINGESYPSMIHKFFGEMPQSLQESISRKHNKEGEGRQNCGGQLLLSKGYTIFNEENRLQRNLKRANLPQKVEACLDQDLHWKFASSRWNGFSTLETLHNDVHMACGYPMSSVSDSAFHPIFFLHHANVDRIMESYFQKHGPDECRIEFASMQRSLVEQTKETNQFTTPLAPFKHPLREEDDIFPADTFVTTDLGYRYDSIPSSKTTTRSNEDDEKIDARPVSITARFRGLDPSKLTPKSYMLHVFVVPLDENDQWSIPQDFIACGIENPLLLGDRGYAGFGSVFGGRDAYRNCCESRSIDVVVPLDNVIQKLSDERGGKGMIHRDNIALRVVTEDEFGCFLDLEKILEKEVNSESATGLVRPIIEGPLFDNITSPLRPDIEEKEDMFSDPLSSSTAGEVRRMQTWLSSHGYFANGVVDGIYGPKTEDAVTHFQEFLGLNLSGAGMGQAEEKGVACCATKRAMMMQRYDCHPDIQQNLDEEKGSNSRSKRRPFKKGSTVDYQVGTSPGYLDRWLVLEEIDRAMKCWSEATGITLQRVKSLRQGTSEQDQPSMPSIKIAWVDDFKHGVHEGSGGSFLRTTKNFLLLDASKSWGLQSRPARLQSAKVFSTVLHGMGHILGLSHSSRAEDAMSPYYKPDLTCLSENDQNQAKAVYTDTFAESLSTLMCGADMSLSSTSF